MAPLSNYLETAIGRVLSSRRGHDSLLLTRAAKIASLPNCISVSSSEYPSEESPHDMLVAHTQIGGNSFPELHWKFTNPESEAPKVQSWVIVVEDPDAPVTQPIVHGIYYGIPASKMSVGPADLKTAEDSGAKRALLGDFHYGLNRRRTVYSGPRPVMGHGVHRYFYQVIGVGEGFDVEKANDSQVDGVGRDFLLKELEKSATCWGEWVGSFQRVLNVTS